MQPIGKIKEEINFDTICKKRIIEDRKEVYPGELPYQVRINNPQVILGPGLVMVKEIRHHQPSYGPAVQHWS